MGNIIFRPGTSKCHGIGQGCLSHRATPSPQACALVATQHPNKCLNACPYVPAHGGVAAQPATGVQHMLAFAREGSLMRQPTRGYPTCVSNARPRRAYDESPACAPIINSSGASLAQPMRSTVSLGAWQDLDASGKSQNILEASGQCQRPRQVSRPVWKDEHDAGQC